MVKLSSFRFSEKLLLLLHSDCKTTILKSELSIPVWAKVPPQCHLGQHCWCTSQLDFPQYMTTWLIYPTEGKEEEL